ALPHVHLARRVPPAAARGQCRPAPDRHRPRARPGRRCALRCLRAQARCGGTRDRAPGRTVGFAGERAGWRSRQRAAAAAFARDQCARPAQAARSRLRQAAVAALADAARDRRRRGRTGRDRRQVRRIPRAPARGDRAPAAPRDHAHSRRLRLRAGTRPVRRSAAEARTRAPGNHRPGAAHPRRHARRHLPAARARRPAAAAAAAKGLSMRKLIAVVLLLAVAACGKDQDAAVVAADPKQPYTVHEWPIPAQAHSGQPDLALAPDGRVLLTWISRLPGRRPALMYVGMADNGHWYSSARSVVVGESLMASWANVPHIAQTPDGALWIQ